MACSRSTVQASNAVAKATDRLGYMGCKPTRRLHVQQPAGLPSAPEAQIAQSLQPRQFAQD